MVVRRALFVSSVLLALAVVGCGGHGTTPLPPGQGTPTPGVPAANATPVGLTLVGSVTTPEPLATPAGMTGPLTTEQLEGLLVAAQTPAPGSPIGVLGTVTQVGATGFSLLQSEPLNVSAAPAGVDAHAYYAVGSAGAVSVLTGPATVFAAGASLASIQPGELVIAAGSPSGSNLAASFVAAVQQPTGSSTQSAFQARAQTASRPALTPALDGARHRMDSVVQKVTGAFTGTTGFPSFNWAPQIPQYTFPGNLSCLSLQFVPQVVYGDGAQYNFPFTLAYQQDPPGYVAAGSGYNPPSPFSDWMTLTGYAPATGNTAQIELGIAVGLGIYVTSNCANTPGFLMGKPITVASATLGYSLVAVSNKAMPGPGQKITLTAPSNQAAACVSAAPPLNFTMLINPKTGKIDLTPFDGVSPLNLQFCDPAVITGAQVLGTITRLEGAGITGTTIAFDPSTGDVTTEPGQLQPTQNQVTFDLGDLQYLPTIQHQISVSLTFLNVGQSTTPQPIGDNKPIPLLADDVPVLLETASNSTVMCITVTNGSVDQGVPRSSCTNGAYNGVVSVNLCTSGPGLTCTGLIPPNAQIQVTDSDSSQTITASDVAASLPSNVVKNQPKGLSLLCGDGAVDGFTMAEPIQFTPSTGSNYTVTAGAPSGGSTVGDQFGCFIIFYDGTGNSVQLNANID